MFIIHLHPVQNVHHAAQCSQMYNFLMLEVSNLHPNSIQQRDMQSPLCKIHKYCAQQLTYDGIPYTYLNVHTNQYNTHIALQ